VQPETLAAAFQQHFSLARMRPYEVRAGGEPQVIVDLYDWNIRISAGLFEEIGVVEILVRNSIDCSLRGKYELFGVEPWFMQTPGPLFREEGQIVDETIRESEIVDPSRDRDAVIASLTFGFWRILLHQKYRRLWGDIEGGFQASPRHMDREDLYTRVDDLYQLRNAIAHHDLIIDRDLAASHRYAVDICGAISPAIQVWLQGRPRVPALLNEDPRIRP
jgi:hypothetical protein